MQRMILSFRNLLLKFDEFGWDLWLFSTISVIITSNTLKWDFHVIQPSIALASLTSSSLNSFIDLVPNISEIKSEDTERFEYKIKETSYCNSYCIEGRKDAVNTVFICLN